MHLARLIPITLVLGLLAVRSAAAQTGLSIHVEEFLTWGEYFGMVAIGWGTGVTGWLVSGHQAMLRLFVDMPRAWKLWQKNALTTSLPIYKYLLGGGLLLMLGTILLNQLWGFWTQPFDVGLLTGVIVGAGHSFVNAQRPANQIDFLEANQRYLNEKKVALFTEYDGS